MQGISGLPKELLAYQEVHCSMELVSFPPHLSYASFISPYGQKSPSLGPQFPHIQMRPVCTLHSSHCIPHLTDFPTKQIETDFSKTLVPVL